MRSVWLVLLGIAVLFLLTGCGWWMKSPLIAALPSMQPKPSLGMVQNFQFTSVDGTQQMSVSDFHGQPLVLNFWADWCPPCVAEFPHFAEVYRERAGTFALVSVAVSSSRDIPAFLGANPSYDWTFGMDLGAGAELYEVRAIPLTLFIDRNGKIVDKVTGGMDKATFEAKLAAIL